MSSAPCLKRAYGLVFSALSQKRLRTCLPPPVPKALTDLSAAPCPRRAYAATSASPASDASTATSRAPQTRFQLTTQDSRGCWGLYTYLEVRLECRIRGFSLTATPLLLSDLPCQRVQLQGRVLRAERLESARPYQYILSWQPRMVHTSVSTIGCDPVTIPRWCGTHLRHMHSQVTNNATRAGTQGLKCARPGQLGSPQSFVLAIRIT